MEIFEQRGLNGWQIRRRFSVEKLLELEGEHADSPILDLHSWYRESDSALRQIPETMGVIGTQFTNPLDYVLENHIGIIFGPLNGYRLEDYPIPEHAVKCAFEYQECKYEGKPIAHHIEQNISGIHREYVRILCPLIHNGRVEKIIYTFRFYLRPPILIRPELFQATPVPKTRPS